MPKGKLTYRRGEIRWVKLDPTVGAEAQKTRACLIIQMDTINQHGLLTIVVPFLPGQKKAPYIVNVVATEKMGWTMIDILTWDKFGQSPMNEF